MLVVNWAEFLVFKGGATKYAAGKVLFAEGKQIFCHAGTMPADAILLINISFRL